jgi:hypothetical protein
LRRQEAELDQRLDDERRTIAIETNRIQEARL